MKFFLLLGVFSSLVLAQGLVVPSPSVPVLSGLELREALRQGGYTIYFRHAITDRSQQDLDDPEKLSNCALQRNLNPEGRAQARAIGVAFKNAGIPVGEVLSSPFCRCLETGRLAFGRVERRDEIRGFIGLPESRWGQLLENVRGYLATRPRQATNRVLIGHNGHPLYLAGIALEEGDAAIWQAKSGQAVFVAGQIKLEVWQGWAK
jgi:phosphohistidine phosphatase SixA